MPLATITAKFDIAFRHEGEWQQFTDIESASIERSEYPDDFRDVVQFITDLRAQFVQRRAQSVTVTHCLPQAVGVRMGL